MHIKKLFITIIFFCLFVLLQSNLFAQAKKTNNTSNSMGTVIAFPAIDTLTTSPDFTVKVNNTPIWIENVGDGGIENLNVANYAASGKQTITIKASANIIKYLIKP